MQNKKRYIKKFFGGALSSFAALLTFFVTLRAFFPENSSPYVFLDTGISMMKSWTVLFCIFSACFIFSILRYWPKLKAEYNDERTHTNVVVECCNLLDQNGLRVIHTTDTFDTDISILGERTLNGQFLSRMSSNPEYLELLNNTITEELKHYEKVAEEDQTLPGRKYRYPMGTICRFDINNEHYCLVAFSSLEGEKRVKPFDTSDYASFFEKLWTNLSDSHFRIDEGVINVAVVGNKYVALACEYTTKQRIEIILDEFYKISSKSSICNKLRICIAVDTMAGEIDYSSFDHVLSQIAGHPRNS